MRRAATLLLLAAAAWAGERLVVVAPAEFHPALTEYLAHRGRDLPTLLVDVEVPLREERGADAPERLKRWLHRLWREGQVSHVLLVGDVDVLPVRYMTLDRVTEAAFHVAFYPSDLYYADLAKPDGSFDDWNGAREGIHAAYFGEVRGERDKDGPVNYDGIDYLPEIAVGRWPASTVDEVRTIAAKTLAFERAPAHGRAGVVAVGGWVDCRPLMHRVADALGPSTARLLYEGATPPTEDNVVALLRGADLVLHAGHGEADRWDGCLPATILPRLADLPRPPVLFSAGCSTALFAPLPPYDAYVDVRGERHAGTNAGEVFRAPPCPPAPLQPPDLDGTGLGERLLFLRDGGAVAYVGCNTGSQPCGLTLLEGFALACAGDTGRLGSCWNAALRHYHAREKLPDLVPTESWYPPSVFFQGMKFMLFGDPALRIR